MDQANRPWHYCWGRSSFKGQHMTEPERRERLLTFLQALKDHYAQMRQETTVEAE